MRKFNFRTLNCALIDQVSGSMLPVSEWAGHFVHRRIPEGICFTINSQELPPHYLPPTTQGSAFNLNQMNHWNLYGKVQTNHSLSLFHLRSCCSPKKLFFPPENTLLPQIVNQFPHDQMVILLQLATNPLAVPNHPRS